MSKIKILDDNTINKIAAGEVIERPFSIVKELVENSIDAHSTNITVEIKNGGKSYIRVTDNGSGIEKDDLELAFLRHSTSKIQKVEDLQNIITLGFRGEALASIASVSETEILSKTRNDATGCKLSVSAGEVTGKSEVATSNGTTIIVKNLFYNIPVRKKFLKSDSAETTLITELLYKMALGNPSVSFKYIKDGSMTIKTSGNGKLKDIVYSLFGKEFLSSVIDISHSSKNTEISGLISDLTFTRGNRAYQYIFINGRSVKSLELSKKIENIYKDKIPSNRFPVFIIYIEIDPKEVDINIHPSKTEVRFLRQEELFSLVEKTVSKSLNEAMSVPEMKFESHTQPLIKDSLKKPEHSKESSKRESNLSDFKLLDSHILENKKNDKFKSKQKFNYNKVEKPVLNADQKEKVAEKPESDYIAKEKNQKTEEQMRCIAENKNNAKVKEKLPFLRVIGLLFNTYILAEDSLEKSLWIIDQHAAHERVMYEKLCKEILNGQVYVQETLALEPIELSISDIEKLKEYRELLNSLGFNFEEFGHNTVVLRSVPLVFGTPDYKELFIDILDNLQLNVKNSHEYKLEKIMKLACTLAVKAGDDTKLSEIEKLLLELDLCENPFTCPHGRPTVIKMKKSELEKKFKRI